jgi:hypothetical protein
MNFIFGTSIEGFKQCNGKIIPLSLINVQKFVFPNWDIFFSDVLHFKFFSKLLRAIVGPGIAQSV